MPKALIIFETRKGATQLIAETLQESLILSGIDTTLKRLSEIELAELDEYDALILGSPTYNKDLIGTIKPFLFRLERVNLKGRVGASFGAYGWSGEAVEMLSQTMKNIYGMDVVDPGFKLAGNAGGTNREQFVTFGQKIAQKIKKR